MLDPQLQGISWVKEREAKRGLVSVRMGAPDMLRQMEKAMAEVRAGGGGRREGWDENAAELVCSLSRTERMTLLSCGCSLPRACLQGQTVLIENMGETIDAVLTPLVTRATVKKVGTQRHRVGGGRGSLEQIVEASRAPAGCQRGSTGRQG